MAKRVSQVIDKEVVERATNDLPTVPGLEFSWQNPFTNERTGWRIWEPVTRDSEIGQQIADQFGDMFDKFQGLNEQTNYFMRGRDSMLAFTSKERLDAAIADKQEKADAQMLKVEQNAENLRRNVLIQTPMGKK